MRSDLRDFVEQTMGTEYTIANVDIPHVFDSDDRIVHNWPGVHRGSELKRAWDIMWREGQTNAEFERNIYALASEQFGWAREMLNHDVAVAGVRIHLLDPAGHAYGNEQDRLKRIYERAGVFVAEIREILYDEDDLLILSDHRIVVDWYNDNYDSPKDPRSHSWRAFASSTRESVRETVFAVVEWINDNARKVERASERLEINEDLLQEFDYI